MLCVDGDFTTDSLISSSEFPVPLICSCFDGSALRVVRMSLLSAKASEARLHYLSRGASAASLTSSGLRLLILAMIDYVFFERRSWAGFENSVEVSTIIIIINNCLSRRCPPLVFSQIMDVPYMQSNRNYNSTSRLRQSRDSAGGNTVAASMLVSSSDKHSRQSELGSTDGGRVNGMSMMMPATTRNSTSSSKLNRSALIPGGGFQFASASKLTKSMAAEPVIKPPKNKKEVSQRHVSPQSRRPSNVVS